MAEDFLIIMLFGAIALDPLSSLITFKGELFYDYAVEAISIALL